MSVYVKRIEPASKFYRKILEQINVDPRILIRILIGDGQSEATYPNAAITVLRLLVVFFAYPQVPLHVSTILWLKITVETNDHSAKPTYYRHRTYLCNL